MKSSRTPHTPRILLIEDNRMGLAARRTVLEEIGYRITATSSPQEALDALSDSRYDLIITDYKLPGMNGTAFIEKVRESHPQAPVILISGFVDSLGLTEKNTGADFVLQKGANEVNLMVRNVRSLLRRASLRKPPGRQGGSTAARRKKA
jgi:two-component system NtrC family response regulator